MKKLKLYRVKRVIVEEYDIEATSKKEASNQCENPHTIYVKSEKITLIKNN